MIRVSIHTYFYLRKLICANLNMQVDCNTCGQFIINIHIAGGGCTLKNFLLAGVHDFRGCKPLVWGMRGLVSKDRKVSCHIGWSLLELEPCPLAGERGNQHPAGQRSSLGQSCCLVPGLDRSLLIQRWIPGRGWVGETEEGREGESYRRPWSKCAALRGK